MEAIDAAGFAGLVHTIGINNKYLDGYRRRVDKKKKRNRILEHEVGHIRDYAISSIHDLSESQADNVGWGYAQMAREGAADSYRHRIPSIRQV